MYYDDQNVPTHKAKVDKQLIDSAQKIMQMIQQIFKGETFTGQVFYNDAGSLFPVSANNEELIKRYSEFASRLTS